VDIEFDPEKDAINLAKHALSLAVAAEFDIDTALTAYDDRAAPEEDRWVAIGFIGAVLHVLVFTERDGKIRPISLRHAERQEINRYADYKARYGF
jgi:uncharacterized DUF497 family protein